MIRQSSIVQLFWLLFLGFHVWLVQQTDAKIVLWSQHCPRLPGTIPRQLCMNYTSAASMADRICAAATWKSRDPASYKGGHQVLPPALPTEPIPSAAMLAGSTRIALLIKPGQASNQLKGAAAAAGHTDVILVDVDTVRLGPTIPHGFLGISMEYPGVAYYGRNVEAWGRILRVLGPGAVIRVGGASQDKLQEMPDEENWSSMAALHKEAGMRFIIGVPLQGNSTALAAAMIQKAKSVLPAEALAGIELGNEPSYWPCTRTGGWDAEGIFEPGWAAYSTYFDRIAKQLSGCDKPETRGEKLIMGPGWDNLNTLTIPRAEEILQKGSCYLRDLSVHYYPYYSKKVFSIDDLLHEDLAREASRNATLHVQAAARFGQKVRITEANSMSGAGIEGISDSYAAALWTADVSFEFAAAGIKSLHFHWGHAGLPEGGVLGGTPVYAEWDKRPNDPAPWFGFLLFQAAVSPKAAEAAKLTSTIANGAPGRLATVTAASATNACRQGQVKVWPVLHESDQPGRSELRVVILNKSDRDDCTVVLRLNDAFEDAVLAWVDSAGDDGKSRMASKDISFGGARYTDLSGGISGLAHGESIKAEQHAVGSGRLQRQGTQYSFFMRRASAGLLVAQDKIA